MAATAQLTTYRTEHTLTVSAPARVLYDLVADVTRWPAVFGPSVHVRHLERDEHTERFEIWALVNGEVANWARRIVAAVGPGSRMNAKDVLATCFNGYQLTGAVDSFDLREFHRLAERGYEAAESGDPAAASVHLGRALRLWSGPALNDVPVGRVLRTDLVGMEEARMRALRQRIDADLLLGRHSALVPELRTLTAQHPMDENLCAQLMTSLYRSGGTSRALEAFQRLRRTLIDELGIEPSPRVQRLHQAVLLNTPDLEPLREEWTAKLIGRPVAVPST